MSLPDRVYWTVDEYYQMADSGLIAPDSRVELLDGEVIRMAPIGSRHASCVFRLNRVFSNAVGDRAIVLVQSAVRLSLFSEPEPDLALLRPRADVYASGHAGPEDVLLLVEVADTSARWDRNRKVPLYLRAGIPEVWLVDLNAALIEVFIGESTRTAHAGDTLAPQAFPDIPVDVAALLPT